MERLQRSEKERPGTHQAAARQRNCQYQAAPNVSELSFKRQFDYLISSDSSESEAPSAPRAIFDRSPLSTGGQPAPIKRLLARNGCVWLFEVSQGEDVHYQVERGDLVWRFRALHRAAVRFIRTLGKYLQFGEEALTKHAIEKGSVAL